MYSRAKGFPAGDCVRGVNSFTVEEQVVSPARPTFNNTKGSLAADRLSEG